ncbi:MAG: type II secretion system protein [Sedimentisphaerales bacterium]|nr:type II secretion system protein [Sedimentisphaerales bacterium]
MPDSFKPPLKEHAGDMKTYGHNFGLSLIEMLVVLAVIAILITMVLRVTTRIDSQGKERLTKSTFSLINSAMEEFSDYGYRHKDYSVYTTNSERDFYRSLIFPPDCNDFPKPEVRVTLENALDTPISIVDGTHDPKYSGSEALYFFLSEVPQCREILGQIDESLITNEDANDQPINIMVDAKPYPFFRVIDPWGTTLRYDYYDETAPFTFDKRKKTKKTFPVITSAGPDEKFNTADDISSR